MEKPKGAPKKKPPWKSKTFWASAVTALAPVAYPPAAAWIAANPASFSAGVGVLFNVLRWATRDGIGLGGEDGG